MFASTVRFPRYGRGSYLNRVSAVIARGKRPVPFRTRKLSLSAPMVLQGGPCGRVGRCRTFFQKGPPQWGGPFCVIPAPRAGSGTEGVCPCRNPGRLTRSRGNVMSDSKATGGSSRGSSGGSGGSRGSSGGSRSRWCRGRRRSRWGRREVHVVGVELGQAPQRRTHGRFGSAVIREAGLIGEERLIREGWVCAGPIRCRILGFPVECGCWILGFPVECGCWLFWCAVGVRCWILGFAVGVRRWAVRALGRVRGPRPRVLGRGVGGPPRPATRGRARHRRGPAPRPAQGAVRGVPRGPHRDGVHRILRGGRGPDRRARLVRGPVPRDRGDDPADQVRAVPVGDPPVLPTVPHGMTRGHGMRSQPGPTPARCVGMRVSLIPRSPRAWRCPSWTG